MTKVIYIKSCADCPFDNRGDFWICSNRGIMDKANKLPDNCMLSDAPKTDKPKVIKTCAVGYPCYYLNWGDLKYKCNHAGLCEYQRPREVK
jgi:hypothetical protein